MLQTLQRLTPMWLLGAAGLALGVANLSLDDPYRRSLLMGGAALASWLLAALGALARRRAEPLRAPAWNALAAGFLVTSLFTAIGFARILFGLNARPTPAPALFITWLALSLLARGWVRFQPEPIRGLRWLELALDGANFLASLLLAYWLVFLRDAFQAAPFPLVDRVATLGLLFGIAGLAGIFGRAASWSGGFTGPLGCISLALLLMALNLPFLETFLARQPFIGHPAQTVMIPVWLLMIAASRRPFPVSGSTREGPRMRLRDLLSYAPLAIALPAFLYATLVRKLLLDPFALALLGAVLAGLGARQVLAMVQLRTLNRTLEERVEARTRELAEAQSTLLRTERMNLVATLGAGAVHDINNLLSSALLAADLALEADEAGPPLREGLERVRASIGKAGALTRRLLEVGQPATGPVAFDPQERVRALLPVLRGVVPRRIELEFVPESSACCVAGDPQAFDQVLVNLVSNARDAIPGRGSIRLRCQDGRDGFRLEVIDTGQGFPEAARARLFEPFFTTKPSGTGLGLSSSRAIIDGFGGRIELDTAPGLGTAFRLHFPIQPGTD